MGIELQADVFTDRHRAARRGSPSDDLSQGGLQSQFLYRPHKSAMGDLGAQALLRRTNAPGLWPDGQLNRARWMWVGITPYPIGQLYALGEIGRAHV